MLRSGGRGVDRPGRWIAPHAPILLALVAVAAGCRTRPYDDGAVAQPSDASAPPSDLVGCASYELVAVPLLTLEPGDKNMCPADLARVSLTYPACFALGPVTVAYDAASNTYTVTAHVWHDPRCDRPSIVERVIDLSETARPQPGMATVVDGAPGATLSLQLPIQQPLADGKCGSISTTGCRSDADCEAADPRTRCWYDGGQCERICFDDADCPDDAPACSGGFCASYTRACDSTACAWGQQCTQVGPTAACRPGPSVSPGTSCRSNDDCGTGGLCLCDVCSIPCAVDADCPTGARCDGARGCGT